jgi:hypothetical protein
MTLVSATPVLFLLSQTGTSGTSGTFAMAQTDNIHNIHEPSQGCVYRFPSWYPPKPVQSAHQTGTEPVQPTREEDEQGDTCHPDTGPVPDIGNGVQCTGNSTIAPRKDATQPVEHAAHTFEPGPKVPEVPVSERYNRSQASTRASSVETPVKSLAPPPYPGCPVGAPFRPGQQVWLYRWDTQAPRFDAPVTIVQLRTLWPGEQDIGWCDAAGVVSWHNARLAVAVERSKAC